MLKKKLNFNLFFYFEYTIAYFLISFLLKYLFLHYQELGLFIQNKFLEILILKNTGAAFSILKNGNYFLATFAIFILTFILHYVVKNYKNLKIVEIQAWSFLSAGILSNMVERLTDGYVTDYFKLLFINFPVFNLADIFINIGVFMLIISLLFLDKKAKK